MKLFYTNSHCKHILFAGSGDNSYAGFLRQFSPTKKVGSRVILLESLPFASKLEELAHKFECTSFPMLFRDTKILTGKVSFRDDQISRPSRSPSVTYASTARQGSSVTSEPNGGPVDETFLVSSGDTVNQQERPARKIFKNSQGQRVDQPVRADRMLVSNLKPKKLCNRHFLSRCTYVQCTHSHEGKLSAAELDALRFIARLSPCQTIRCEDPDCVAGHRCMQGPDCDRRGTSCWFNDEMHRVDTRITKVVTV